MKTEFTREQAMDLLKEYNKEEFHIRHALTVEGVMRHYASVMGFAEEADYWGLVGLLHDIDFERWPEKHCEKAPSLLDKIHADDDFKHAVVSHGYGLVNDVRPDHEMERVLIADDELTSIKST